MLVRRLRLVKGLYEQIRRVVLHITHGLKDQQWTQSATPTGELRMVIKHGCYGRDAEVSDREHLKLEQQLDAVVGEVIKTLWHAKKRRQEEPEVERQRRADEARRLEQERMEKLERSRKKHLLHMARRRRDAAEIRDYVQHVAAAVSNGRLHADADEFAKWHSWALDVADELDPMERRRYRPRTRASFRGR
jgi:hypothetical protein